MNVSDWWLPTCLVTCTSMFTRITIEHAIGAPCFAKSFAGTNFYQDGLAHIIHLSGIITAKAGLEPPSYLEGPYIPGRRSHMSILFGTCCQTPPALKDHICMTNGMAFEERFHCSVSWETAAVSDLKTTYSWQNLVTVEPVTRDHLSWETYSAPPLIRTPLLPNNSVLMREVSFGEREHYIHS